MSFVTDLEKLFVHFLYVCCHRFFCKYFLPVYDFLIPFLNVIFWMSKTFKYMWCIIYQNFISCLVLSKKLCPTSREQIFFFSRSFTVLDCMLRSLICLKEIACGLRVEVYLFPYVKLKYLGIFHWKSFPFPS